MKVLCSVLQPSPKELQPRKIILLFNLHPTSTQNAKMPKGFPKKGSSECHEGGVIDQGAAVSLPCCRDETQLVAQSR
jgi:hypothetical protein